MPPPAPAQPFRHSNAIVRVLSDLFGTRATLGLSREKRRNETDPAINGGKKWIDRFSRPLYLPRVCSLALETRIINRKNCGSLRVNSVTRSPQSCDRNPFSSVRSINRRPRYAPRSDNKLANKYIWESSRSRPYQGSVYLVVLESAASITPSVSRFRENTGIKFPNISTDNQRRNVKRDRHPGRRTRASRAFAIHRHRFTRACARGYGGMRAGCNACTRWSLKNRRLQVGFPLAFA